MTHGKYFLIFIACFLLSGNLFSQDFGFGFDDDTLEANTAGGTGNSLNISVDGKVSASMVGYLNDIKNNAWSVFLGDIFSGSLNFTAKSSIAEGVINLNINSSPELIGINEAYARAFLGRFDITAGLRKLTWGKADSMGPLDVINPLDTSIIYTEMADQSSYLGVKIAQPLVHASFRFGNFSKIEAVFVPNFRPHYIPTEGKWKPLQIRIMEDIPDQIHIVPPPPFPPSEMSLTTEHIKPATDSVNYFQTGLRFTTTLGSSDIGIQYYYGRLHQPAVKIDIISQGAPIPDSININYIYKYNPYHQIGIDYAQVLFGFNVRAEAAVNITEDTKGDDGSVYNPNIAWSLGFDKNLFWGIDFNIQANQSIRLFHNKIAKDSPASIVNNLLSNPMNVLAGSFDIDIEGGMLRPRPALAR
ncbi:MAG: hypothetical protein LBU88_06575 [Treponema sp.]|jgi:hypothetical protein|nr:hypothetical protein [Treponema sp.]